jgi:hypothetical protein
MLGVHCWWAVCGSTRTGLNGIYMLCMMDMVRYICGKKRKWIPRQRDTAICMARI